MTNLYKIELNKKQTKQTGGKNMYETKEETKKGTVNQFGDWIKSIPVGDYDRIRHEIISQCKITNQIFTHWKLGNSKVPPLAQDIIIKIAGKNIFKTEL